MIWISFMIHVPPLLAVEDAVDAPASVDTDRKNLYIGGIVTR